MSSSVAWFFVGAWAGATVYALVCMVVYMRFHFRRSELIEIKLDIIKDELSKRAP